MNTRRPPKTSNACNPHSHSPPHTHSLSHILTPTHSQKQVHTYAYTHIHTYTHAHTRTLVPTRQRQDDKTGSLTRGTSGSLANNYDAVIGSLPKGLTEDQRARIAASMPMSPALGMLQTMPEVGV